MPKLINELRWTQGMKLINQIQSLSYYQVIKPFQTRPIKPQLLQPPRPSDSSHLPNRPLDVEIGQVPSRRMPKADLAKMFDWQSHTEHKYGKPKAIHHHTPSKLGFMTLGIPWHTSIWDLTLPYMTPHRWWVGSTLLGVLNLTKTLRDGFLMSIIGCSFLMQFGVTHPRHGWTSKGILWTWNHDHCRNLFLHIFTAFLRSQGNQHKPQLDWRSDPLPNTAIPLKEQEERNWSDKRKKSVLGPNMKVRSDWFTLHTRPLPKQRPFQP